MYANTNRLVHCLLWAHVKLLVLRVFGVIRHTSRGADLVILGGDFNTHSQDLGCRLLRTYTGLRDSYAETETFDVSSPQVITLTIS